MTQSKAKIIAELCSILDSAGVDDARSHLNAHYPHESRAASKRRWSPNRAMRIFARDGFIDRYTGARLVNPGVLHALAILMPQDFPAHPNWKMSESHIAFWELYPTLDHVIPIARGGADEDDNIVSTSQIANMAKAHWTLEEMGWTLKAPGSLDEWDGLSRWLLDAANRWEEIEASRRLRPWLQATRRCLRLE